MINKNNSNSRDTSNRREIIKQIIQTSTIINHEEMVNILGKEYGIQTNQSQVSRDFKSLGIIKNKRTNYYQLDDVAKKEMEKEQLQEVLINTETDFIHGIKFIGFRTKPEYAHLVAARLESFFSSEDYFVAAFVNPSGSIALLVSEEIEDSVMKELNTIFQ